MMKKGIVVMFVNIEEERVEQKSIVKPICSEEKTMKEVSPEIWTIIKK